MTLSVLITQCLQRDFVDPVGAHEPLPNALHVGRAEALRLMGHNPPDGPVAQLMSWARAQPPERIRIVHVRDWHDPDDAGQYDHFAQFGIHCVRGTPGARLVLDLEQTRGPNEHLIDSLALNDFEGTSLGALLDELRDHAGAGGLRVGVVGVWTEAKVSFLLYDLKTRGRIENLATCSALTASASRAQHFNALDQLRKILGVAVFDSLGEFAEWLLPDAKPAPPKPAPFGAEIAIDGAAPPAEDLALLRLLYRESARIALQPLGGGFSGARVYKVASRDALGHEQAPSVAKVGPRKLIAAERVAFERVEAILGNNAPSVRAFVDLAERGGLKYSYAAMGQGAVRTFQSLVRRGEPVDRLVQLLQSVFTEILGRFYAAAQYERLPLLEHYGFSPRWADGVRRAVDAIRGGPAPDRLAFGHGLDARNVLSFYEDFLPSWRPATHEYHFVSFVHGDLNGANILLDPRDNVWLIDFFHAARGHVLQDLAKLENDLLYVMTPIDGEAELAEAFAVTRALREVTDLRAPLPTTCPGVTAPALVRAWRLVGVLRGIAAELCREDRHPLQHRIAALRYAVHTLSFDEPSALQKRWALASACVLAEDVRRSLEETLRLRVDEVPVPGLPGSLGLTLCPGRRDRGRSLDADLEALHERKTDTVVSLLTAQEEEWAGVPTLRQALAAAGFRTLRLPIPDQGVPSAAEAAALVDAVVDELSRGRRVVLHCLAGLGRSGLIAACVLRRRGVPADEAIAAVRRARDPRAVETRAQEEFLRRFG